MYVISIFEYLCKYGPTYCQYIYHCKAFDITDVYFPDLMMCKN